MMDDKFRALIDARRDLETAWGIHLDRHKRQVNGATPLEGTQKALDMADDRYQDALKAWAEACGKTG